LVTGNIVADSGNGTSSDQPLTGGRISLSAAGNVVFVSGNLSASATGAGSGGIIEVKANSLTQLTVGSAATSATGGVKGTITAAGGGAGGAGGSIHIENGTTGSVKLSSLASLSVAASGDGGNGGKIEIVASGGTIFLADGTLSADASAGGDFVGG